jgi:hypothetical protein
MACFGILSIQTGFQRYLLARHGPIFWWSAYPYLSESFVGKSLISGRKSHSGESFDPECATKPVTALPMS